MKKFVCSFYLMIVSIILVFGQGNQSQPTEVLLLGVFHFHNPGLDAAKFRSIDIMSTIKQNEVLEIVDKLKAFKPDKIFVEHRISQQPTLDSVLRNYKAGKYALTNTETDQIGIRLAAQLEHNRIYGIDYSYGIPFDTIFNVAELHNQDFILKNFMNLIDSVQRVFNQRLTSSTIKEMLLWLNQPELNQANINTYFNYFRAGDINNHAPALVTSAWYQRNITIYELFMKYLEPKDRRVLVIFGQGHTALLQHFMSVNPKLKLILL